jgi:hypothetical protein
MADTTETTAAPVDPWRVGKVTNPAWLDAAHSMIGCTVDFPNHPNGFTEPHAYRAVGNDTMPHGKQLFLDLLAGKYGPVAEYVADTAAIAADARRKRYLLLRETDWTQLPDASATHTAEEIQAWLDYRQALRDVPTQAGFPLTIDWPTKPA